MNYTDLLTEQEIDRIISSLPMDADSKKVKDILDLLAFYGECKMIFDGVTSGDLEITGANENGLEYRLSSSAKRRLH